MIELGHLFLTTLVIPVMIWSLLWKGWALWLAARRGEKIWFIAVLVINTLGIFEIIYIFVVAKRNDMKVGKDTKQTEVVPLEDKTN